MFRFLVVPIAVGVLLLQATGAQADQSFGYKISSSENFDGYKGTQDIRTDPATVNGIGYVHASQVDVGALGGTFIAIGTAKGVGTYVQGSHNCTDDYDAKWTVYTDGEIGGVYFCYDEERDAYGAGDTPGYTIEWGYCPSASANRWLLYFGGTLRACRNTAASTGSMVSAMLETTGGSNVDRNIDVKFKDLQHRSTGSTYVNWGSAALSAAPSYSIGQPTNTQINIYLAPLD